MDWDDEYDIQAQAGPSFIDRARNALPDDDFDVPMHATDFPVPQPAATNETPLEQLIRHWMNERHAPDILPAQEELLASLLDHLRRQVGNACLGLGSGWIHLSGP